MARRISAYNPEGDSFVTEQSRFDNQRKNEDRQNWLALQQLQMRKDALVMDDQSRRDSMRTQRESVRNVAPRQAQNQSNGDFIMVNGVPVSTRKTKLNLTGHSVPDYDATEARGLEIAQLMQGNAADRSQYAMDLQGVKNDPRLQETERLGEMDAYNRMDRDRSYADKGTERSLHDLLMQEQMNDVQNMTGDRRDPIVYGQMGQYLQDQRAEESRKGAFGRDLALANAKNPNVSKEYLAQVLMSQGGSAEDATMAAEINPARSQQLFSNIIQGDQVVSPVAIKQLTKLADVANAGVLPYWSTDDMAQADQAVHTMMKDLDVDGMMHEDKLALATNLMSHIKNSLGESGSSYGNAEVLDRVWNIVNQRLGLINTPKPY